MYKVPEPKTQFPMIQMIIYRKNISRKSQTNIIDNRAAVQLQSLCFYKATAFPSVFSFSIISHYTSLSMQKKQCRGANKSRPKGLQIPIARTQLTHP